MNITILANQDVASCLAVNYLLTGLTGDRVSLFLSSRVGSKPLPGSLEQLKFIEQDLFNQLLWPLLSEVRAPRGELQGFDQQRHTLSGRLQLLNNINEAQGLERFCATEPELVLSVRYGHILKAPAIGVPGRGILNLHSGRLPDYKGVMATFWAMLNNEQRIGTTLHYIDDSNIDTGRIVAATSLALDQRRSYLHHVLELYRDGCLAMLSAVDSLREHGQVQAHPQPQGGHYYSFPDQSQLDAFATQGWRLWDPDDVSSLARRFTEPVIERK